MKKSSVIMIIVIVLIVVLIAAILFGYYKKATMEVKNPIVTMEVEGYGTIKIELYPDQAPESVANFVNLAQNGFYNGTLIHRISSSVGVIQGGGYKPVTVNTTEGEESTTEDVTVSDSTEYVSPKLSDLGIKLNQGEKDSEYCIKGEFIENGVNNTLRHKKGVLSMARADYTQNYSSDLKEESYNSATSQFFIMTDDNSYLDGIYAAFGKVIEGMDVVEKIAAAEIKPADENGTASEEPASNIVVTSVSVDTQGVKYNKPKTLTPWNYYNWLKEYYGVDANSLY